MNILINHRSSITDTLKLVESRDDRGNAAAEGAGWEKPTEFDAQWGIFYQTPGDGITRQASLDLRYVTNDLPAAEQFVAEHNISDNPRIARKIAAGWIYVIRKLTEDDVNAQRKALKARPLFERVELA